MSSTSDNITVTIAAAIKELADITKHLTNIVDLIKNNIDAYWAIKDASARRSASEKIRQLSSHFSDIGFIQLFGIDTRKHESSLKPFTIGFGEQLDDYALQVDKMISLLRESFPELIKTELSARSLNALLEKKRVAKQFQDILFSGSLTEERDLWWLVDEVRALNAAFAEMSEESINIAKLMRQYADAMKQ